jgi:superfamily II DNA or RNA helicase
MFCTPSQVNVLLGTFPLYIIGCTATLEKSNGMELMAHSMIGTHKIEVKNLKKFTVYKLNTGINTEIVKNKQGTADFSKLTKDISLNPLRNAFIVDLIEKNQENKFMILTWSKQHVNILFNILQKRNQSVEQLSGNKSSYVDSRILIGTISKVSTGFDAKNVAINWDGMHIDTMILVGSTKSQTLHIQSIGRVFRSDNPTIIDFVDEDRISKNHWKSREKIYNELNCEIKEFFMKKRDEIEQNSINNRLIANSQLKKYHERKMNLK